VGIVQQISPLQIGTAQVGPHQDGSLQDGSLQAVPVQVGPAEIKSRWVPSDQAGLIQESHNAPFAHRVQSA
jgi:hypothetical protein